jgi:uroporphyrinogen-III synthase
MRIVLTRPEGQNDELAERLRELGHEVIEHPLIAVERLGDEPIELGGYDWLIITSANGARELRRRGRGRAKRVAAVGQATADAFGGADLVPPVSTQEGLLAALPRPAGRVLFAGAKGARRLLVDELGADFVPLYRTRELRPEPAPDGDLVVLASPSAARAFASLDLRIPAVSIGPETTAAAEAGGAHVVQQASTHDLYGLVAAVRAVTR